MGEAAVHAAGEAAVEPDGGLGQALEEAAIVADQHERRAQALQLAFQPFDDRQVEMVRRLVEQQDVGLRAPAPGQAPRGGPRRRRGRRASRRRSARAAPAGSAPGRDRRPVRGPPPHRPGCWHSRKGRAPGRDSARWRPGCTKRLPRSASTRPAAILSRVDLPEPLRPTRQARSPGETDSSALSIRGVPPKVRAMSWRRSRGGSAIPAPLTPLSRRCKTAPTCYRGGRSPNFVFPSRC